MPLLLLEVGDMSKSRDGRVSFIHTGVFVRSMQIKEHIKYRVEVGQRGYTFYIATSIYKTYLEHRGTSVSFNN